MSRLTARDYSIIAIFVVAAGAVLAFSLAFNLEWALAVLGALVGVMGIVNRLQFASRRPKVKAQEKLIREMRATSERTQETTKQLADDTRAARSEISGLRSEIRAVEEAIRAVRAEPTNTVIVPAEIARNSLKTLPDLREGEGDRKPDQTVAEATRQATQKPDFKVSTDANAIVDVTVPRSPYRGRPRHTFWKTSIAGRDVADLQGLYKKKFEIGPSTQVATAGSCFAQHISRHLRSAGYMVIDTEPGPQNVATEILRDHGYGVYSARYGNIYYVRQLLQLTQEALELRKPEDITWKRGNRWYDALRPSVEPDGLASPQQVERQRVEHLRAVKKVIETADVFVFTMGLTEGWIHTPSGTVYPTAPGTIAGNYDPEIHHFHNFDVAEVVADFTEFRALAHSANPNLKFLLTVSPVPLAATATDSSVLVATTLSKSVLRAAAGHLASEFDDVDYFPSYEIVTSHAPGNVPFDESGRNVRPETVEKVMAYFMSEHAPAEQQVETSAPPAPSSLNRESPRVPALDGQYAATDERIFCEEAVLEAFADED